MRIAVIAALLVLAACSNKKEETPPAPPPAAPSVPAELPPPPPSGEIKGRIEVAPEVASKVAAGDTLYLIARNAATGGMVAVARLSAPAKFPMEFKLDGSNVMMPGMSLAGTVKLSARIDKDGDAMSKNPGDVTGEVAEPVTVGKGDVVLTLAKVL